MNGIVLFKRNLSTYMHNMNDYYDPVGSLNGFIRRHGNGHKYIVTAATADERIDVIIVDWTVTAKPNQLRTTRSQ